jgi:GTP-binding protein
MRRLTERAVEMADASLFLIDARTGVTPTDRVFAEILRRSGRPVILAANKAEGRAAEAGLIEAWELGLGEPLGALGRTWRRHGRVRTVRAGPLDRGRRRGARAEAPETDVDVDDEEDDARDNHLAPPCRSR